jgi:glycogen synthase
MIARLMTLSAAAFATALMVASLWAWQQAPHLVFDADRPDIALWAVRTTAVAAAALAQAVLLLFVVGRIYRTRGLDIVLRVLTATVFTVALVSAIALGLAGR